MTEECYPRRCRTKFKSFRNAFAVANPTSTRVPFDPNVTETFAYGPFVNCLIKTVSVPFVVFDEVTLPRGENVTRVRNVARES